MARAPPGGGSPVVALAVPASDVASSGGGLDAKVRLSFGKPRRRLTLAPAPAEHDVPGVVFGFGIPVDELSSAEEDEDGGVGDVLAEEDGEYLEGAADGISIDMVAESPTVCPMKVVIAGSLDGVLVDKLPAAFSVVGGVSDDGVCGGGSPFEALLMADTGATMVAADLV
ncbi:NAD(P)-binding Rossmann-fold superfamily protein [Zea mays]|uniref:NAD(P)-binding Rossmann-fold superfamily protein n=1 Tax=Zea mays TaxID=4577 RepID=A0A1D6QPZ7_MAIZE|nr:NAD(P)-binding Rossmann-fold superfamily protein [Zea mays]